MPTSCSDERPAPIFAPPLDGRRCDCRHSRHDGAPLPGTGADACPRSSTEELRQTVTTAETPAGTPTRSTGARIAVQKFGTFLSGMIMPNIAAFIAWGFITAFFIETGWTPIGGLGGFGTNDAGEPNTGLVGPMIRYMLPLLIAVQGGRMVYGVRGAAVAARATMGVKIG